ncbi:MAG: NeuD/PglB/VioB family sugar acetyltransferase [Planctomycetota bacterium]
MSSNICYVLGAGGHGKVILSLLRQLSYSVAAVFDDDPRLWGSTLLGAPIRGPIASIREHANAPGVLAIGDNRTRASVAESCTVDWLTCVHPSAHVDGTVVLGDGVVVLPNATVQVDAVIGNHAIINSASTVEHDCTIGRYAHVAPASRLAGATQVKDGALLGIGSTTNVGVRIGAWATVGAGAVVVRNVPDHSVVVGVPARPLAQSKMETSG